jgi:hypothetical protein
MDFLHQNPEFPKIFPINHHVVISVVVVQVGGHVLLPGTEDGVALAAATRPGSGASVAQVSDDGEIGWLPSGYLT